MMPWVIAKASPTEPIAVQCFKTWAGKIYIDSYRFYLQHEILPPVVSLLSLQDHQIDPNRISKCPTLKANARPAECILRFCEPISKSPTFLLGWISWNFHFHSELGPMQGKRCRSKFAKQSAIRQVPPVALAHLFDRFAVGGRWWKFYIYFICHQHPLKLKATPLCLPTIWSILTNGCRSCGASHPRCAGRGCDLMQNLPWCVE